MLLEQPGVREAAVVGVPDERRGERPVAFFAGDADPAALEAACRRQLASFKVPAAFVRVDALPRNALGKVEKARLRAAWRSGQAARSPNRRQLVPARLRLRFLAAAFCAASSWASEGIGGGLSDGSFSAATSSRRRSRCSSWPSPADHATAYACHRIGVLRRARFTPFASSASVKVPTDWPSIFSS